MCNHKWIYDTPTHRTCIMCGQHQKEGEYSGWGIQKRKEYELDVKEYKDFIKRRGGKDHEEI